MSLGYGRFGERGISFYLFALPSPLGGRPIGRRVGGEGVSAQRRVAPCNESLRNAHASKVSGSPHPHPSTDRSTPKGEGLQALRFRVLPTPPAQPAHPSPPLLRHRPHRQHKASEHGRRFGGGGGLGFRAGRRQHYGPIRPASASRH